MGEAIAFYTLATLILGFGILVISVRNIVHSVLFLVADLLLVAALYVTLAAEFLAVIQILVYAGGIVVLYLFVVMLVRLKRPELHADRRRLGVVGLLLAGAVLLELVGIAVYSASQPMLPVPGAARGLPIEGGNTENLGWVLYTDYLIPFEVASMLLLVAMIGAIVLAKREAGAEQRLRPRELSMVMDITPLHYSLLSSALFMVGVIGVLVRRNIIIIFMSIELILNAVNINLVAFSNQLQNLGGQVFAVFVIAVAAAEAAVGLGIILAFYRNKETVNIDEMNVMKW